MKIDKIDLSGRFDSHKFVTLSVEDFRDLLLKINKLIESNNELQDKVNALTTHAK